MTRVIMNGCNGKMGQCITGICKADEDIEIVAGIDLYDGIKNDYPVFASIDKCDVEADVSPYRSVRIYCLKITVPAPYSLHSHVLPAMSHHI